MMKISKSVLLNNLSVSPVQFTSLNSVLFKNVKTIYDGNQKIVLEYEYQSTIDVSSRDYIGIFPRGWNTLQQYVTFEWVTQPLSYTEQNPGEIISKTVTFCPKYHINAVNSNCSYQFVYVSKQIEVLGVSSYFRFDLTNVSEPSLELESLVPVSARLRSTSFSDFGALLTGTNESSSTSLANRISHVTSIQSLQNLISEGKYNRGQSSPSMISPENNGNKKPPGPSGNGDAFDPYSSHSEPGFPMSLQMTQCNKLFQVKRWGDLMRSQQILQSKLKIVMERNNILEKRAQDMKKEMERLQSDSKKMKMSFYHLNKEKVAYEKFVKDLIKSLEKDSFVRVMNGNTEILVKKVNYVGMEEHPRDKKTSKRERELKAVIGLQEITIRNLINNLQEKVKSVQELNQTIKLAQAFSADPGEDPGDSFHDMEEVPQSEGVSECEFTLTRPQPPEEVPLDADAVLDDIRKNTETELKHIGINRSLGECSSGDSEPEPEPEPEPELDLANLSVLGYSNQVEDNIEKVESPGNLACDWSFPTKIEKSEKVPEEKASELQDFKDLERETQVSVFEDYFDACDGFSVKSEGNSPEEMAEEKPEEFLMAEIVPRATSSGETEETVSPEKGKKFTCEFSIDFSPIRPKSQEKKGSDADAEQEIDLEESRICMLKRENSLITFKKSEKCFEIEITQVDQKDNPPKNCLHQKMIVKFGNDEPKSAEGKRDPKEDHERKTEENPKIEVNLALETSGSEKTNEEIAEILEEATSPLTLSAESKSSEPKKEETSANETASSRTVWNDAVGSPEKEDNSSESQVRESDDGTSETSQEPIDETLLSEDSLNNFKLYQDSLTYEKNLEFLKKKMDGRPKEDNAREKPSAILIQNGATKVALIRYQ